MLNMCQFSQYTGQLQSHEDFAQKMISFKAKAHLQLVGSMKSSARKKMEVRRNHENGSSGQNCIQ